MAQMRMLAPLKLGHLELKNRIVVPPMVLFGHCADDGMITEAHLRHYTRLAKGGPGLIVQEATCVTPGGRLSGDQPGIWSDDHIPGLRRVVEAVHGEGVPVVVQLHHGGIMSVTGPRLCPSAYIFRETKEKEGQKLAVPVKEITGQAMTDADIDEIRQAFVNAGRRAYEAGYDGVELHSCHSYLLCQFLNRYVNQRTDIYGSEPERLVLEIAEGIRAATNPEFLIGIRLGGFEPDLETAVKHAKVLAEKLDFLDISYGFQGTMDTTAPGDETLPAIVRAAAAIRQAVDIPVFAVGHVKSPEEAEAILEKTDVDMVAVGRSILVDPEWTNKAKAGQTPGYCFDCRSCQWRIDESRCPGRRKLEGSK